MQNIIKEVDDNAGYDAYCVIYKGKEFIYCATPKIIRNIFPFCAIICTVQERMCQVLR